MRLLTICAVFAATLAGAEVTGTWRGTITTGMAEPTTGGDIPAYLVLKQADGKVTGSAGGDEAMVFPIIDGKMDGDRLTFAASPGQGATLRFSLTLKGEVLEGDVEQNGNKIGTAKLKREH